MNSVAEFSDRGVKFQKPTDTSLGLDRHSGEAGLEAHEHDHGEGEGQHDVDVVGGLPELFRDRERRHGDGDLRVRVEVSTYDTSGDKI